MLGQCQPLLQNCNGYLLLDFRFFLKGEDLLRTEDIIELIEKEGDCLALILFPGKLFSTYLSGFRVGWGYSDRVLVCFLSR